RLSAAATVSRAIPSRRATARWDKPSTRCSRRTSAHVSTGSTPHSWPTPDQDQLDSAGGRLFSRWFWKGFYPLATDAGGLPRGLGEARVAPRLLGVDPVGCRTGQFADGHLVGLGSAFDSAATGGGQVVVPVGVAGCSSPGGEDVDAVLLGVVREVHRRGDV